MRWNEQKKEWEISFEWIKLVHTRNKKLCFVYIALFSIFLFYKYFFSWPLHWQSWESNIQKEKKTFSFTHTLYKHPTKLLNSEGEKKWVVERLRQGNLKCEKLRKCMWHRLTLLVLWNRKINNLNLCKHGERDISNIHTLLNY